MLSWERDRSRLREPKDNPVSLVLRSELVAQGVYLLPKNIQVGLLMVAVSVVAGGVILYLVC